MKKTIVQIRDYAWYEANKDDHGIVYFENNPENETNFFSLGQSDFCGRIATVIKIDANGNYKLDIDSNGWIWRSWMFESEKEVDITDDIIDAEFSEKDPVSPKAIKNYFEQSIKETLSEDKTSIEYKTEIISLINKWKLSFNTGSAISQILFSDKDSYKHNLELAIVFLQNELKELNEK